MVREDNVKYSIVFLNYDPENRKDFVPLCLKSVIESSVGYAYELIRIRDVEGYVRAVNAGLRQAKGEFIFIVNDDVVIDDPKWLEKMAMPGIITSWRVNKFHITGEMILDGACYCIPREVYEKLGDFDERYAEGYGCDEVDYWFRAKEKDIPMIGVSVNLKHLENKTYQTYFSEKKNWMTERNEELFRAKWKNRIDQKLA